MEYPKVSSAEIMSAVRSMDVYGASQTSAKTNHADKILYSKKGGDKKASKYVGLNYQEIQALKQKEAEERKQHDLEKYITKKHRINERIAKAAVPADNRPSLEEFYLDGEVLQGEGFTATVCDGTFVKIDNKDLPQEWQESAGLTK